MSDNFWLVIYECVFMWWFNKTITYRAAKSRNKVCSSLEPDIFITNKPHRWFSDAGAYSQKHLHSHCLCQWWITLRDEWIAKYNGTMFIVPQEMRSAEMSRCALTRHSVRCSFVLFLVVVVLFFPPCFKITKNASVMKSLPLQWSKLCLTLFFYHLLCLHSPGNDFITQ